MSSTQTMTARTTSMVARAKSASDLPSRSTLAARSMREVDRIKDDAKRGAAFARHMSQFPPTIGSY